MKRISGVILMLRTIVVILWTIPATILFGSLAIVASVLDRTGDLSHKAARVWARSILMASGVRVCVKGLSRIDPGRSYIYMSNHQSNFDIPVLLAFLKVQFRWLAKVELFRIPLFGYAMSRARYISIDRSDRKSAFKSLKRAADIIRNGVSVMIFPEGTRSRDGSIGSFKKGGFVLAVDAGVPIVPVTIHGTRSIMPRNRLRILSGDVLLEVHEPLETAPYSRKNKEELMDRIRQAISESFEHPEGKGAGPC